MPMAVEAIGVHDQLYKRLAVERMAELANGSIFFDHFKMFVGDHFGTSRILNARCRDWYERVNMMNFFNPGRRGCRKQFHHR